MRSAPRGESVFGAALIGAGLFALYAGTGLPFGNLREPGAGFFPVVIAVALILFAAFALSSRTLEADKAQAEPGSVARVSILTAMIAAYAWLLPTVGFILCTVGLLVVLLRLGNVGWAPTIISATGGAAACYLLFTRLGMPLPSGLLGF